METHLSPGASTSKSISVESNGLSAQRRPSNTEMRQSPIFNMRLTVDRSSGATGQSVMSRRTAIICSSVAGRLASSHTAVADRVDPIVIREKIADAKKMTMPLSLPRQAKVLGEGGFATVYVGHLGEELVACKLVHNATHENTLRYEHNVLRSVSSHPNICTTFGVTMWKDRLVLVTELCDGGDILTTLLNEGPMKEDCARALFQQITDAVWFCHQRGIVHCDIKLENICMTTDPVTGAKKPILLDFGMANRPNSGSLSYAPPETYTTQTVHPQSDVWSLGICLFATTCGFFPFEMATRCDKRYMKVEGRPAYSSLCEFVHGMYRATCVVSDSLRDLIDGMLIASLSERSTLFEVIHSRWISSINIQARVFLDNFHTSENIVSIRQPMVC